MGEKYLIEVQSREDTTDAVKAPEDSKAFYPVQMREGMLQIPLPSGFVILKIKFKKPNYFIIRVVRSSNETKFGFIVKIAFLQGSAFIFVFAFSHQWNSNYALYLGLY